MELKRGNGSGGGVSNDLEGVVNNVCAIANVEDMVEVVEFVPVKIGEVYEPLICHRRRLR